MKIVSASIYYSKSFGYIITSDTTVKGLPIHTIVNPVIVCQSDIDFDELGDLIRLGIEKSENAEVIELSDAKKYRFWEAAKVKSFAIFSKRFHKIEIRKKDGLFEIIRWQRDNDGSYSPINEKNALILDDSTSYGKIAEMITDALKNPVSYDDCNRREFFTVNQQKVTYSAPTDEFIDVGDGHTDAYRIYEHYVNKANKIAFLIGNQYQKYTKDFVKEKLEKSHGAITEFTFHDSFDAPLIGEVKAVTNNKLIMLNIYRDVEDTLEVALEIDTNTTQEENQKNLLTEYHNLIKTISIH